MATQETEMNPAADSEMDSALPAESENAYPPVRTDIRQFTARAVVTGMILGGLLSLCNVYLGLKIGWGAPMSITAALACAPHTASICAWRSSAREPVESWRGTARFATERAMQTWKWCEAQGDRGVNRTSAFHGV